MSPSLTEVIASVLSRPFDPTPRPGLHPIPGTRPITIEAAILPPTIYYLALLFLPPPPPAAVDTVPIKLLRSLLAIVAGVLFFRLPLAYHVPMSVGLTYQLGLVGLYGGCRVLDAFFISPYLFNHIPRRVRYIHDPRVQTPLERLPLTPSVKQSTAASERQPPKSIKSPQPSKSINISTPHENNMPGQANSMIPSASDSYFALQSALSGPAELPVLEFAESEDGWPHSFLDRASWALELELSMRGVGFTWSTADVRHTKKTFLPTVANRLHSIFIHVLPIMLLCLGVIKYIHGRYLASFNAASETQLINMNIFDTSLSLPQQLLLTGALGAFLMAAFSLAHSLFAILCSPLSPHPLAYFPPLYTTPVYDITSVRSFWAYGWHRLFARLFLVYGVWPGEFLERKLLRKKKDEKADVGKVLGGFLSSAFVHSFAVRGVLGGEWSRAYGEGVFFSVNGLAVIMEEIVRRIVLARRKRLANASISQSSGKSVKGNGKVEDVNGKATHINEKELGRWYDAWIGRVWWLTVLLVSGRNFARGWVNAGLVREMADLVPIEM